MKKSPRAERLFRPVRRCRLTGGRDRDPRLGSEAETAVESLLRRTNFKGREGTMGRKRMNARWLLALAVVLALGALVLAGCGGSSGGGSTAESSAIASPTVSAAGSESSGSEGSGTEGGKGRPGMMNISEEARACLKEKGVESPELKGGGGGPPSGDEAPEGGMPEGGEPPAGGEMPGGGEGSEEMQKAFEECGVETPELNGGPGGVGAPGMNPTAFEKQVKEYVACVRENGYELAEPDFSGEGPVFAKEESESAAFEKASARCRSVLGGPSTSISGRSGA
jgi:hypothetical protein